VAAPLERVPGAPARHAGLGGAALSTRLRSARCVPAHAPAFAAPLTSDLDRGWWGW
jgi:hypothetical protein